MYLRILVVLATAGSLACPSDQTRVRAALPDASLPERTASRRPLGETGPPTPTVVVGGSTLVFGVGKHYYAIDASTGKRRWAIPVAQAFFPPMLHRGRLFLTWRERSAGVIVEVAPASGRVLSRTRVAVPEGAAPGRVQITLNTAPAVGDDVILWPSSRFLFAFARTTGRHLWTYAAKGASPFRRFLFGSDPPLLEGDTAYWGHRFGVAALSIKNGRPRWEWRAHRGFSLRSLLAGRRLYSSNDGAVVALDLATGKEAWRFAPRSLRFEHLSGESLMGTFGGHLWFIGEPIPFRYRIFTLRLATGKLIGHAPLPGIGLGGALVVHRARLYGRFGDELVAIDLGNAQPLWRAPLGRPRGNGPVLAGGKLWVINDDGTLATIPLDTKPSRPGPAPPDAGDPARR